VKAAEEKHGQVGRGGRRKGTVPLQGLPPRVRAGNCWASKAWWGQHMRRLPGVRERRSAEGEGGHRVYLASRLPGKSRSGPWAAVKQQEMDGRNLEPL